MIVVDISALVAMLVDEPEAGSFGRLLHQTTEKYLSAANYVELAVVMLSRTAGRDVDLTRDAVSQAGIQVVTVSKYHADLAAEAYSAYGKGRHPAGLNFGDCFSYALAKALDAPLLFKGADFAATDVRPALG